MGEGDELLQPSVGEDARVAPLEGSRPWRLSSQGYVAFFGGPLGAAIVAGINSSRLRIEPLRIASMALIGVIGLAAVVGFAVIVGQDTSAVRIGARALGLLFWAPMYLIQRTPDRVYHFYSGRDEEQDYDSLLVPGLIVAFPLALIQGVLIATVTG